jgi:hypothetical protein
MKQRTENPRVGSSILSLATIITRKSRCFKHFYDVPIINIAS